MTEATLGHAPPRSLVLGPEHAERLELELDGVEGRRAVWRASPATAALAGVPGLPS